MYRVTWTDDVGKKRPRRMDGACVVRGDVATLYETTTDAQGEDGRGRRVTRARVDGAREAFEIGRTVRLGARHEVYVDDVVGGNAVGARTTDGGGGDGAAARAKTHRFTNRAFRKKFVPPMLKRTTGTVEGMVVGGVTRAEGMGDAVGTREGDERENEQMSAVAKLLLAHDGDLDVALDKFERQRAAVEAGPSKKTVGVRTGSKAVTPSAPVVREKKAPDRRRARAPSAALSTDVCVKFPPPDYVGLTFSKNHQFTTIRDYQSHFVTAMCENLTLRLRDVSGVMKKLRDDATQSKRELQQPEILQKVMWQRYKLRYFTQCEITSRKWFYKEEGKEKTFIRMTVHDIKAIKGPKIYAKGDLWVVSTEASFNVEPLRTVGDRYRAPWVGVVQNEWHGFNQKGQTEVRLLSPRPPALGDNSTMKLFAIHSSLNAFSEAEEIANILALGTNEPSPLIDCVLGSPPRVELEEEQELYLKDGDIGVSALQRRFKLNDDQARAISGALASATGISNLPVRLVHGPFGSGKTHTIAAFVIKAAELLKASNGRIMISAHTNVAVDRVLQKLLELGFTDFVRVGSVRKIDPTILPHSVHAKTSVHGASQVKELQAMLAEATSARAKVILQQEIEALSTVGKVAARKALLKKCLVVGVTTYSSTHKDLTYKKFDVVVLDECSQMTEPSSLLPVIRTRCKSVVAVGDPHQLYPVLETVREEIENASSQVTRNPLQMTLFSRLSKAGYPKVTLRTQYRLHPMISAIPNKCYYDGMLLDGVDAMDRASLIDISTGGVLPPIVWWDTNGVDEKEGQSKLNVAEANRVSAILHRLLDNGISAEKIGVIAFYAAQASFVTMKLKECLKSDEPYVAEGDEDDESFAPSDVQVSTVDAFQGQEKEVIVFTLCGAPMSSFTTSERLNVAITRAKRHLIVVGAAGMGQKSGVQAWLEILKRARSTPNGYLPSSARTECVLGKWSASAQGTVPDIMLSPGFEPELSPSFASDRQVLLRLGFDQRAYWSFYCAAMRAFNYNHDKSRDIIAGAPVIRFIRRSYPQIFDSSGDVKWRSTKARKMFTIDALGLLRRFIEHEYGEDWGTSQKLIDSFEDREDFERDPTGFGWLCLREVTGSVGAERFASADFVPTSEASDDDLKDDSEDAPSPSPITTPYHSNDSGSEDDSWDRP